MGTQALSLSKAAVLLKSEWRHCPIHTGRHHGSHVPKMVTR